MAQTCLKNFLEHLSLLHSRNSTQGCETYQEGPERRGGGLTQDCPQKPLSADVLSQLSSNGKARTQFEGSQI